MASRFVRLGHFMPRCLADARGGITFVFQKGPDGHPVLVQRELGLTAIRRRLAVAQVVEEDDHDIRLLGGRRRDQPGERHDGCHHPSGFTVEHDAFWDHGDLRANG